MLHLDLVDALARAIAPLIRAADSLPGVLLLVLLDSGLWLLGIHAAALTAGMRPIWEAMLVSNMEAVAAAAPLPHVAPLHFYLWFVWQGGSGAALALGLLLLRCRSSQLRTVGRAGILPVLCNINEPAPLRRAGGPQSPARHPFLAAPLSLRPWWPSAPSGSDGCARRTSRRCGPCPRRSAPGSPPGAICGRWSLELTTLALSLLIYWPFVAREDRRLLAEEPAIDGPTLSPPQATP